MFSRDNKPKDNSELAFAVPQRPVETAHVSADARVPTKSQQHQATTMISIIGEGLYVTGNIKSEGDLQVDGSVVGDIQARQLTIGESGKIKGKVLAEEVNLSGKFEGEMSAKSIIMSRSAHVIGDILHDTLSVESGAEFEGRCQRRSTSQLAPRKSVSQTAVQQTPTSQQPVKTVPSQPQTAVKSPSPSSTASVSEKREN